MLIGALLAFGVTFAACPVVLAGLHRYRVIDDPNWRSSHKTSIPRGGGIAVATGIGIALLVTPGLPRSLRVGLLVLGIGAAAIGLADDLTRGSSPKLRLVATTAAAATALLWLAPGSNLSLGGRLVVSALCLGWTVSYINAFNFMDGINGISAGQVLVVAGQVALAASLAEERAVAVAAVILVASTLGFAPFNAPRARMFLGDVGSYVLGASVAGLVIAAVAAGIPVEAAAAGTAVYASDTFVTLMRRVRRGDVWHEAHREHAYQRLTDLGLSHMSVTALVTALAALCAAVGIAGAESGGITRIVALAGIVTIAGAYVALPDVLRPRRHGPTVSPTGA